MRRRTVVALLIAMGCGGQESGQEPVEVGPKPLRVVVEEQQGRPLADRLEVYRPLARSLRAAEKSRDPTLNDLAHELVRASDFAVIEVLEQEEGETYRKRVFWELVSWPGRSAEGRRLVARWAAARPDEIVLARHRPGGVEFLLATLEDVTVDPRKRVDCARELSYTADVTLIPRMSRLADDPTPVRGLRSVRAGGPRPTLGRFVKRCIENLERFAKERDGE
ncbi:MAG: hypothetical protein ACYTF8_14130 [Planctomycetota bacterium]|jgi:hypothetical protein